MRTKIADLSGGVQTKTTPDMALPNQVLLCINGSFNKKVGGVVGRMGSERKSQIVAGQTLEKMFIYSNGATRKYVAVIKDGLGQKDIYVSASQFAGTWTKIKEDIGLTADVNFDNFATKMAIFDGVNAPKFWNGTTLTVITNAPTSGLFTAQYQQKLFVLDADSFLHYSDVINTTGDGLTTDTWLNRGIHPNDGQDGKGLVTHRGLLRIFKTESIYSYDGSNEPDPLINIGTHSSKSIVVTDRALFFHHPTGWYLLTTGLPSKISLRVQKFFDGMDSANWENTAGGKDIHGNVYLWIGDVTISDIKEFDYGETYKDVVLVFNDNSQELTVYSGWNARTWIYDQFTGKTYFGTEDGKIFEINKGYSEIDGEKELEIDFKLIFNPEDWDYPERFKEIERIVVAGEHQLQLMAGESYEKMVNVEKVTDKEDTEKYGEMNQKLNVKELWYGVNQSYTETPPYIKKIYIDKIKISDDER